MTQAECKASVLKWCARIPDIDEYFKIPWDAYKHVWRVMDIQSGNVLLGLNIGPSVTGAFQISDSMWMENVNNGLIWRSSRDEV